MSNIHWPHTWDHRVNHHTADSPCLDYNPFFGDVLKFCNDKKDCTHNYKKLEQQRLINRILSECTNCGKRVSILIKKNGKAGPDSCQHEEEEGQNLAENTAATATALSKFKLADLIHDKDAVDATWDCKFSKMELADLEKLAHSDKVKTDKTV